VRRVSQLDLRQRVGLQIVLESAALMIGFAAADLGRIDLDPTTLADPGFWILVAVTVCLLHLLGPALHPYRDRSGGLAEVLGGVGDIRDLDLVDLLGRGRTDTDATAAAGYLSGRRVLVTGAGGSIGTELCRQIHGYRPTELIMLDRDESALRAVQLAVHGRAMPDDPSIVLGDVRDVDMLTALFAERRPDVVFHAAALKHLPLLERYPGESVKTNVWGTLSILEAAAAAGVRRLVNISTDKAANPTSVLGHSKRITERLTAHVARESGRAYVSVRFGNVLGGNGSVLTVFAGQLAAGGPLTVTHPAVTRSFTPIREAVQLVLQAGALGSGGQTLVLDMGEPVRIADVARGLADRAARAHRRIEIVFTGLSVGEKLHEDRFGDGESDERPHHPLISQVPVPPLDPLRVVELDPWDRPGVLRAALARLGRCEDLDPAPAEAPLTPRRPSHDAADRPSRPVTVDVALGQGHVDGGNHAAPRSVPPGGTGPPGAG
jgi:nucleoside-diphosphate-sugar epimerase